MTPDERPNGWGVCACGADCREEDYSEILQRSICPACWAKGTRRLMAEVLEPEDVDVLILKGML